MTRYLELTKNYPEDATAKEYIERANDADAQGLDPIQEYTYTSCYKRTKEYFEILNSQPSTIDNIIPANTPEHKKEYISNLYNKNLEAAAKIAQNSNDYVMKTFLHPLNNIHLLLTQLVNNTTPNPISVRRLYCIDSILPEHYRLKAVIEKYQNEESKLKERIATCRPFYELGLKDEGGNEPIKGSELFNPASKKERKEWLDTCRKLTEEEFAYLDGRIYRRLMNYTPKENFKLICMLEELRNNPAMYHYTVNTIKDTGDYNNLQNTLLEYIRALKYPIPNHVKLKYPKEVANSLLRHLSYLTPKEKLEFHRWYNDEHFGELVGVELLKNFKELLKEEGNIGLPERWLLTMAYHDVEAAQDPFTAERPNYRSSFYRRHGDQLFSWLKYFEQTHYYYGDTPIPRQYITYGVELGQI